jgi:hypothetical protein
MPVGFAEAVRATDWPLPDNWVREGRSAFPDGFWRPGFFRWLADSMAETTRPIPRTSAGNGGAINQESTESLEFYS